MRETRLGQRKVGDEVSGEEESQRRKSAMEQRVREETGHEAYTKLDAL
jgi:hypothetical protein